MEIWKDISEYKGLYRVSNLGNVKSLLFGKERILKPGLTAEGYLLVVLYKNRSSKSFKVNILVAISFLNHKPCGHKIVVDHINNIRTDNELSNLQLISHRENLSKDRWRANNSSNFVGVSLKKDRNKWLSKIQINGKVKHLGYFDDELEASNVYQTALKNIK